MFQKYIHLERYGTSAVDGIDKGICYIFPKLDGANASIWYDDSQNLIRCASRNRELTLHEDNAGFMDWAVNNDNLIKLVKEHPNIRFYGEWLVPHTVKGYKQDAWRRFYIFDVLSEQGNWIPYKTYVTTLQQYNVDYIPAVELSNPSYEELTKLADFASFQMEEGKGAGEGIVIKRYNFINRFRQTTWAKLINKQFAEVSHNKVGTPRILNNEIELGMADKFITKHLVDKVYAKIENSSDTGFNAKHIPQLLQTVYHDFINEELWNALKDFKNPTINFKLLTACVNNKVKELKPEVFGFPIN